MSEAMKIVLTSGLTVISASVIMFLTEVIKTRYLTPFNEFRKIRREIAEALVYWANHYMNPVVSPSENTEKGSATIRGLSAKLSAVSEDLVEIPRILTSMGFLKFPGQENLDSAAKNLMGISNRFVSSASESHFLAIDLNDKARRDVMQLLSTK